MDDDEATVVGDVDKQFDAETLKRMKKAELVELVMQLKSEKDAVMEERKLIGDIHTRVVELERSQFLYEQYGRRESVEISGIPADIKEENLEDEVIKIYEEAKVKVFDRGLTKEDISACHRIGKKKETTIVRFVNRKFAFAGLINGKNLKNCKLYEDRSIYINNSFCREFAKYGYYIRKLKDQLTGYRVRQGVHQVQFTVNGDYHEVSHESDFQKYGLDIEPFQRQ